MDEIEKYCENQEKFVFNSIPTSEHKTLAIKLYFKYHTKTWKKQFKKECNLYNRDIDLTNNLTEIFNGKETEAF